MALNFALGFTNFSVENQLKNLLRHENSNRNQVKEKKDYRNECGEGLVRVEWPTVT